MKVTAPGIYVEILFRGSIENLWEKTQNPMLHQCWGLRFSDIENLAHHMDEVWHGALFTLRFLYVGAWRWILFPERGQNVPFTVQNYAFSDDLGQETVTWIRTFNLHKCRRFDAYMIYGQDRGKIVDYMGSHEHLAVDLDVSVDEHGGLKIRSGAQRFYEGRIAFSFPMIFSGIADVTEWYDDAIQKFRIEVNVHNSVWGPLFGYRGRFDVEWRSIQPNSIPAELLPLRIERRN